MRNTSAGVGLKNISSQLGPNSGVKPASAARGAGSFEEFSSRLDKLEKAKDVMQYGGTGGGRKFLYGATSSLIGEKNAEKIARKFGNKKLQEEAFQTLYGGDQKQSGGKGNSEEQTEKINKKLESTKRSINNKIERVIKTELKKVVDQVKESLKDIPELQETINRIEKRLSPKDITVGKGDKAQTFRFDPLAPEGKQVTEVKESGLAGGIASKEGGSRSDYQNVLSKAAFLGNQELVDKKEKEESKKVNDNLELMSKPSDSKLEKIDEESVVSLIDQIKKELKDSGQLLILTKNGGGGVGNQQKEEPNKPKNFEEYSKRKDEIEQAQDVMKYGGKSGGRKFLFGATQALIGEKNAEKIARKFGNKQQQEEAFQTLNNEAHPNQNTGEITPQNQETDTQKLAEHGTEQGKKSDAEESSREDRQKILDKLDEILNKLNSMEGGGGGGMGSLLSDLGKKGGVKAAEKIAAKAAARAAARSAAKKPGMLAKIGSKLGGKTLASLAGKTALKSLVKKIPIVGAIAGLGFAAGRLMKGDVTGAAMEAASGIAGTVPGVGTATSVGMDVALAARDASKEGELEQQEESQSPEDLAKTPPEPIPNPQERQVSPLTSENRSLRRPQAPGVAVVNAQSDTGLPNMVKAGFENVLSKLDKNANGGPDIIQIRNNEPSVSTYVASIFDHPVVHPGIYRM